MLGEKNLYAYCDNNPIIKGDSEGENPVITGIIGATVNIIAGGVAAVATGQNCVNFSWRTKQRWLQ